MPRVSLWSERCYPVSGHVSYFWPPQSKWVTWSSNKHHLTTIIGVTYIVITRPNNSWHGVQTCRSVALQCCTCCNAFSSHSVPAATRLSGAPLGPTSDSTAVLMLLQHTVYIYNLQALPLLGYWDELRATWILELRRGGRGKRGPHRPAMPPLPGSFRLMGRQGFG